MLWERKYVTGSLKSADLACARGAALPWSLQDSWMLSEVQLNFLLSIKCGINRLFIASNTELSNVFKPFKEIQKDVVEKKTFYINCCMLMLFVLK